MQAVVSILEMARDALRGNGVEERELAAISQYARIGAVLDEVDQTMLPRALVFSLGETQLTIEVRSRKAVVVNGQEGLTAGEMASLISGFVEGDGTLTVKSTPSSLPASNVTKGHSKTEVADALGSVEREVRKPESEASEAPPKAEEPAPAPPVEAGDAATPVALPDDSPLASTWMAGGEMSLLADDGGDVIESSGSTVPAAQLASSLAGQVTMTEVFLEVVAPGARLVMLTNRQPGAPALVFSSSDGTIEAAVAPQENGDNLVDAWRQARNDS